MDGQNGHRPPGQEGVRMAIDSKKVDTRLWAFTKAQEHLREKDSVVVLTPEAIEALADRWYTWATQDPR